MQKASLPKLFYGTAWKKEKTATCVEMALECGFRGIDTACQPKHYDEALVGLGLERAYAKGLKREELFIQTKFTPLNGQDPNHMPYDAKASLEEQIATSLEVSKRNLQTTYLDSWVLHSPLFPYSQLLRAWRAMEECVDNEEVIYLGISNCYDVELLKHLYHDAIIKPTFLQNRFYNETEYDREIRAWCDKHHLHYQSFWTLSANPHLLSSELFLTLASRYKKTPAQIMYRYVSHKGIIPLIGSTSQVHLKEDLDIFTFELTLEEIEKLDSLLEY